MVLVHDHGFVAMSGCFVASTGQLRIGFLNSLQGSLCLTEDRILLVDLRRDGLSLMAGGIDVAHRVRVRVEIAVEARRIVDLAEVAVLTEESPERWIEVPGLGVEQPNLRIPLVTRKGKTVLGSNELIGEAEVAPGVQVVAGDG